MLASTVIGGLGAAWWVGGISTFALSLGGALAQPWLQRRRATNEALPPVSLLLPVKIVNPGFARAQGSVRDQDYPAYEVIVGAAETASPALDAMREILHNATVECRIVHSEGLGAVSPKLDTLATPLALARHDVVVTKDSNITFAPDTLRTLLRSLAPGVGLVCAVPVAVRPGGIAGRIEAILINRDARLLLTASTFGKGFGVGKVMLFRREDLARAGGVAAMAYTIAEDSAFAKGFAELGLRTVFAEATVGQEIGRRTIREVYARQARWAVIRRAEEPLSFPLEPMACPLPAAVAAACAAPLVGLGPLVGFVATLLGWYCVEVTVTALKRWEVRPWTPLAFLGRDAVLLAAWLMAWTTREVVWAGGRREVRTVLQRPAR